LSHCIIIIGSLPPAFSNSTLKDAGRFGNALDYNNRINLGIMGRRCADIGNKEDTKAIKDYCSYCLMSC
jgi:hypothetical protein